MNLMSIPSFASAETVHVVVETPRGSGVKLKYDWKLEAFTLSRPLTEGLVYPHDWGFVPSTRAADGDPLDAIVAWDLSSYPAVVLACRLIGVVTVEQNSKSHPGTRERNDRVVVVPSGAERFATLTDVQQLPSRMKEEIEAFFTASTAFEKKDLAFCGWLGPGAAYEMVKTTAHRY